MKKVLFVTGLLAFSWGWAGGAGAAKPEIDRFANYVSALTEATEAAAKNVSARKASSGSLDCAKSLYNIPVPPEIATCILSWDENGTFSISLTSVVFPAVKPIVPATQPPTPPKK